MVAADAENEAKVLISSRASGASRFVQLDRKIAGVGREIGVHREDAQGVPR